MLIQTNTDTVVIVLDSTHIHNFCGHIVVGVKTFISGIDMSWSVHVKIIKKVILVLGKVST